MIWTDAQRARWFPTVGFSDLADLAVGTLWDETTHRNPCCREAGHAMTATALLWGLARHASLGRASPRLVEIGVQRGCSTQVLLSVAAAMDGHLWSMDTDPFCGEGALRAAVARHGWLDRWTFRAGPSQTQPPIPDTDFLLVDGDHGYAAVCADMATHGTAVRPGGLIVLDDYHHTFFGKVRWVQERWTELQPLTIGPHVVIVRQPEHTGLFQRDYSGERWEWSLKGA